MKQLDSYDNDMVDYQDGTAEARKGSLELVSLTDVESLDAIPANAAAAATDDEADINFFDDDLSD